MEELLKVALEGSGIATFVYFVIKGMRKEITALSHTIQHQNETFDAMGKRITETERMAASYKQWWEELPESDDKHKAALTKTKDEYIAELQNAIDMKDEQRVAKTRAELEIISLKERTIKDLKRHALETEEQLLAQNGTYLSAIVWVLYTYLPVIRCTLSLK